MSWKRNQKRRRRLSVYSKIDLVILAISFYTFVANSNFEIDDLFDLFVVYDKIGNQDGFSYVIAFAAIWAVIIHRLLGVLNPKWRQPYLED